MLKGNTGHLERIPDLAVAFEITLVSSCGKAKFPGTKALTSLKYGPSNRLCLVKPVSGHRHKTSVPFVL